MSNPQPNQSPTTAAEALQKAMDGVRLFGIGFVMVTPDGVHHVPPEAVKIDRNKVLGAQNGRE